MSEPSAVLGDGALEFLWQQICQRHMSSAFEQDYREYPDLKSRAITEATSFASQERPTSPHDLNLRRVDAWHMLASWRAELARRQGQPLHRQSPPAWNVVDGDSRGAQP